MDSLAEQRHRPRDGVPGEWPPLPCSKYMWLALFRLSGGPRFTFLCRATWKTQGLEHATQQSVAWLVLVSISVDGNAAAESMPRPWSRWPSDEERIFIWHHQLLRVVIGRYRHVMAQPMRVSAAQNGANISTVNSRSSHGQGNGKRLKQLGWQHSTFANGDWEGRNGDFVETPTLVGLI